MALRLDPAIAEAIARDERLWSDFTAICDCGGRQAGSGSEARARALIADRLAAAGGGATVQRHRVDYRGWHATRAELHLAAAGPRPCHPLIGGAATAPGGLEAEVIDLGRGTPAEFQAHGPDIPGRVVLVRHEPMFATGTIHRGAKYDMARAAGAVGFLIAGPLPGGLVAGAVGWDEKPGIPALGIAPETGALLCRGAAGWPRARIRIDVTEAPAVAENLILEKPGREPGWIVLSAHLDGHAISESAIDNASGVAVVLAVLRALGPEVRRWRRGLRVALFNVEEWGLIGSARYVGELGRADARAIALDVNLDSIAGSPDLTALTSGFAELEPFLLDVAAAAGQALRVVRPLMVNSDHANFAKAGIPACRLVAGFDDPGARLRHVLTAADSRDKVTPDELRQAAQLSAAIVAAACQATPQMAAGWRGSRSDFGRPAL